MKTTCPKCDGFLVAGFKDEKWVIHCIGSVVPYSEGCNFKISIEERRRKRRIIDFEERRK